jgi:DNA-binding NtrC family response regulator
MLWSVPPGCPRVLVADDEPHLLRVVVRALEQRGHAVVSASDGEQALQAFQAADQDFGVVVLDAAIGPGGSEPLLAEVVRDCPDIGVVITSGGGLPKPLRELMERADGVYLAKPFRPSALFAAVDHALGRGD